MENLIIYAHPKTKGHNTFTLEKVKKELEIRGRDYEAIDLYAENYEPVLKEEEHYTSGNRKVSKENKKYQNKIKEASNLIFIYPVWWGSMPAILKGFLDRVLTHGFAYSFKGDYFLKKLGVPRGLLKKKAVVFMTAGASRWQFLLAGNAPKSMIKYFTLRFCGIKSKIYQVFNCRELTNKNKSKIMRNVRKGLEWLF